MDSPAMHLLKAKLSERDRRGDTPTAVTVSPEMYRILYLEEQHASLDESKPAFLRNPGKLSVLGVDVREDDRLTAFEFEE